MQTQPVEDIDAVLGRFQAWTGSRNAVEAKPGIRELSVEEALRSSRYRWRPSGTQPAKKDTCPELNRESGVDPAVLSESQPSQCPKTVSKAKKKKQTRTKQVRAGNRAAKAPSAKISPAAKSALAAKAEVKPAFRDILVQTVQPAELVSAKRPMDLSRQVAISVRLSPAERALIKTRATDAGISASAYVRQCALEVEQLRAQVQQAVAAMERPSSIQPSTPVSERTPGFFSRLVLRILPRRNSAIALRA